MKGDRVSACKVAISGELWAHALAIAAQIDKETYRDVMCQFSRKELSHSTGSPKTISSTSLDRPAMRVLYSLFGGLGKASVSEFLPSYDECIAKGVPIPSLSTISRWREVLIAIISNRTPGDLISISALGDQLKSYGFNAAAQVW
jgi:hypothetical protein